MLLHRRQVPPFLLLLLLLIGASTLSAQVFPLPQDISRAAPALRFRDSIAFGNNITAAVNISHDDPEKAIQLLRRVIGRALSQKMPSVASEAFANSITIYNSRGQYAEAFEAMKEMLAQAQANHMEALLPVVYNSMGNRYQRIGKLDSSLLYYYQAIAVVEKNAAYPIRSALPTFYTNLSSVLSSAGDYTKAIGYLLKAEVAAQKAGNTRLLTLILINKGSAYRNMDSLDQSVANLQRALNIAQAHHYIQWQYLALNNLAGARHEQKRYAEALTYLQQATSLKGDVDPRYRNLTTSLLGRVYFDLQRYKRAETYLLQSFKETSTLGIAREQMENSRILAQLYERTGAYRQALAFQNTYTRLHDSIDNQNTRQNLNQLEIRYQTAQKDKSLVEKELRINKQLAEIRQKNQWIILIACGTLFLMAIVLLLYRINKHKQRFFSQRLLNLERGQEINQLKAMMDGEEKERIRIARELHDGIGGMLASIKMNIAVFKEEYPALQAAATLQRITGMISGTASEVRRTAHNLMPDALNRRNLKEALLIYCEQHNHNNLQLEFQYHVPIVLKKSAELFLYRIVQELLQNILKHAEASYAAIQIILHENILGITVEDNGKGFDHTEASYGSGLENIQARVAALHGNLLIDSTRGRGTIVQLQFDSDKLEHL
ncbi:ATP-binding protein [Taibaiella koreensis]|uniref:ATP-binding protein n=1 Tax=Taibaiella koreensis TaxID=1268548 RepID=UPI000E59CB57|nr:histidine kinase [Taibaiella koreensis]